jgi:hypothetical protein
MRRRTGTTASRRWALEGYRPQALGGAAITGTSA